MEDMTRYTIGLIIKELEEHPDYTKEEIIQRHRDLYRDLPASRMLNQTIEENESLRHENNELKQLIELYKNAGYNKTISTLQEENQKLQRFKDILEEFYVCRYCHNSVRLQSDFSKELASRIALNCCSFGNDFSEKYFQLATVICQEDKP